ncbi:histidine phosphatase family protein [Nitrincola iocasae]|uniref:Histidine phosphatase family protein n=1 Tax=Nitrincola iocasae TaxID=2614693 RepID=A0A5J6LCX1_9GAMM|nr:histidine phosphatase family protein [Nitrincola iocasae]QEW06459.1 histidine phosphatase family protein [Nitrincola iocasae]
MKLIQKPFVFLRHGETAMNQQQRIGGRTDTPLNSTGQQEADAAAVLLADICWRYIAASPLLRAWETAQRATRMQNITAVDGLRERDWGLLEGAPWSEVPPYTETPPEGESWADFTQRVVLALNNQLSQHDWPLIVAHSGIFRVIRAQVTGTPEGERIGNAQPILVLPPDAEQPNWTFTPLTTDTKEYYFD